MLTKEGINLGNRVSGESNRRVIIIMKTGGPGA
jgi:hypothetical protein